MELGSWYNTCSLVLNLWNTHLVPVFNFRLSFYFRTQDMRVVRNYLRISKFNFAQSPWWFLTDRYCYFFILERIIGREYLASTSFMMIFDAIPSIYVRFASFHYVAARPTITHFSQLETNRKTNLTLPYPSWCWLKVSFSHSRWLILFSAAWIIIFSSGNFLNATSCLPFVFLYRSSCASN